MNKISKLKLGATGLLTIAFAFVTIPFVAAAEITDAGTGDLNSLAGAVADSELVRVTTLSVLTLDAGNQGQAASVDAFGAVTEQVGDYNTLPSGIQNVIPNTQKDGYSYHVVKTNNTGGYALYLMMCTPTSAGNWTGVAGCIAGQNLVARDGSDENVADASNTAYIAPTVTGSALSGTVSDINVGGFWGYRSNYATHGAAALGAVAGDYKPVPAFAAGDDVDDYTDDAYGDAILTSATAGSGIANTVFSVKTNTQLPEGIYANYVIYTAVAN